MCRRCCRGSPKKLSTAPTFHSGGSLAMRVQVQATGHTRSNSCATSTDASRVDLPAIYIAPHGVLPPRACKCDGHESQMGMVVQHVQWCSVNSVRAQLWMTYQAVTITINETPVIHNKDTWKRVALCNMTRMRPSARTNAKTPRKIMRSNAATPQKLHKPQTRGLNPNTLSGPAALPSDGLEQAHLSAGNRRPMCVPRLVRAVNR